MEFGHPCNFWYKVFSIGKRNWLSYAATITIVGTWPTYSHTRLKSLKWGSNISASINVSFRELEGVHKNQERV
jgi:hypothetical protein